MRVVDPVVVTGTPNGAGLGRHDGEYLPVETVEERLRERVAGLLKERRVGGYSLLMERKPGQDDPLKLLIRDAAGLPAAVVLVANSAAPGLVGRGACSALRARERLGETLGRRVLVPAICDEIEGVSVVVLPWCQPLSDRKLLWRVQREMIRPELTRWLREVVRHTRRPIDDVEKSFLCPLRYMTETALATGDIRRAARTSLDEIEAGSWKPCHVLEHNDVWRGNVLLELHRPRRIPLSRQFVLTDWPGARIDDGYPIYDLVRMADSFGMSRPALAQELRLHAEILECPPRLCTGYLLASLGRLGLEPEYFPEEIYRGALRRCFSILQASLTLLR